ncbi:MAG TPA: hypothetical protein VFO16_20315 [Pseudonocardiaceae bacterium]|nr:hypothetical protein [Pseudonocardiaceae bacterium]
MYQASYHAMCEVLRGALARGVQAGHGPDDIGSVSWRVGGALYALLLAHPIDRQGRCRSCRRRGAVLRLFAERCHVHREARYWLYQPEEFLRPRLAQERQERGLLDMSDDSPRGERP